MASTAADGSSMYPMTVSYTSSYPLNAEEKSRLSLESIRRSIMAAVAPAEPFASTIWANAEVPPPRVSVTLSKPPRFTAS